MTNGIHDDRDVQFQRISDDGKWLIWQYADDGTSSGIHIMNLETEVIRELQAGYRELKSIYITSDGKYIIWKDKNNVLKYYSNALDKVIYEISIEGEIGISSNDALIMFELDGNLVVIDTTNKLME